MLDELVEVDRRVGVQRRGEDATVTERTRAKLGASLEPSEDLVVAEARDGRVDDLAVGQHVPEAQLAVFKRNLDLL